MTLNAHSVSVATDSHCDRAKVLFRKTNSGYIRIFFLKKSMKPEFKEKYFYNGLFQVDHPIELPDFLVDSFGLKAGTIYAGKYKVREFDGLLAVDFDPWGLKSHGSRLAG